MTRRKTHIGLTREQEIYGMSGTVWLSMDMTTMDGWQWGGDDMYVYLRAPWRKLIGTEDLQRRIREAKCTSY